MFTERIGNLLPLVSWNSQHFFVVVSETHIWEACSECTQSSSCHQYGRGKHHNKWCCFCYWLWESKRNHIWCVKQYTLSVTFVDITSICSASKSNFLSYIYILKKSLLRKYVIAWEWQPNLLNEIIRHFRCFEGMPWFDLAKFIYFNIA